MARAANAFIDKIIWQSAPKTIGGYQWRAIRFTLPERYGKGLSRSAYQYRRAGQFGAAPELWTDAQDHPGYARYLPNNGLPKQLKSLWDETGDLISDEAEVPSAVAIAAHKPKGTQLGFAF